MAGANENAARVGHLLVAWYGKEPRCTSMHAGPDGIGAQAEQQLEYSLIGLRPHLSERSIIFVMLPCPVAQRPVLIVDENTTIFYRGCLQSRK